MSTLSMARHPPLVPDLGATNYLTREPLGLLLKLDYSFGRGLPFEVRSKDRDLNKALIAFGVSYGGRSHQQPDPIKTA